MHELLYLHSPIRLRGVLFSFVQHVFVAYYLIKYRDFTLFYFSLASHPMGTGVLSPGGKDTRCEADNSFSSSAVVKNFLHSPIRLHGVMLS
jgi:hypothetical protein